MEIEWHKNHKVDPESSFSMHRFYRVATNDY